MMLLQSKSVVPNAGYIILPRRFIEAEMPALQIRAQGEYKLIKHRNGIVLQETPWFDNILLNGGMNRWATNPVVSGAAIGTGTSTPVSTQVGLDVESYWTTNGIGNSATANASSPYETTRTFTYRTTLGALNGNYSEVAVGWASGNNKFSRALILDGGGSPTTISVASTEQLDILYRLAVYPPLVDIGPTDVTISGNTYSVTGRAAGVSSSTSWTAGAHGALNGISGSFSYTGNTQTLGGITSQPSGLTAQVNASRSVAAYSDGSLTLQHTYNYGLNDANHASGIGAVVFPWAQFQFQYAFNPRIPKDATKTLSLSSNVSWAIRP